MNRKIEILFFTFYYSPDLSAGSFRARVLIDQLSKLLPDGSSIHVLTTLPNRYGSYNSSAPEYEEYGCIKIYRIPISKHQSGMIAQCVSFSQYALKAFRIAREVRPDLVVATSSRLFTALLGALVSKFKGAPLYLDIRDIFVDSMGDVLPKAAGMLVLPVLSMLEKVTIAQASKVNFVSKGFKTYFSERYPDLEPSFFTNGIDDEFLGLDYTSSESSGKEGRPVRLVYAGNIGEGQGLERIVPELAKKLDGKIEVMVIGDGGRRAELSERVKALGCSNVTLLTPVSRGELVEYYRMADILFLHLNNYQAFERVLPSKLFEYAATGKPILAGLSGYAADFVASEITNAQVFPPCDVEAAVKAMRKLDMTTNFRDSFVVKFRRSSIAQELANDVLSVV